jgi:aminopeptidase YwaD
VDIPERCVGSEGNRQAMRFVDEQLSALGWQTAVQTFDAMDWREEGARVSGGGVEMDLLVSPYSLGCDAEAVLLAVSTVDELEQADMAGKVVLLHGDIASEQLMPKNFSFYNPESHQRIIAGLEAGRPDALICATRRNAALAGGVYPFPLIEDGDFHIPSVYTTEEQGHRLLALAGQQVHLVSSSRRLPGTGGNVIARYGTPADERIVITAHIDAKKGTPGAIDNATGVVILLLLGRLLAESECDRFVELVALNGEDYYSAPGQMLYIRENRDRFHEIRFNINLDGVGYKEGPTAFSFYTMPDRLEHQARTALSAFPTLIEGTSWPQGDHSIFLQHGRPAMALSSHWLIEHMESQEITHTPKDHPDIVDCGRVSECALALATFLVS